MIGGCEKKVTRECKIPGVKVLSSVIFLGTSWKKMITSCCENLTLPVMEACVGNTPVWRVWSRQDQGTRIFSSNNFALLWNPSLSSWSREDGETYPEQIICFPIFFRPRNSRYAKKPTPPIQYWWQGWAKIHYWISGQKRVNKCELTSVLKEGTRIRRQDLICQMTEIGLTQGNERNLQYRAMKRSENGRKQQNRIPWDDLFKNIQSLRTRTSRPV